MITDLFKGHFGKKEKRILMLGLDAAGKSVILYRLKRIPMTTEFVPIITIGSNVETVKYNSFEFAIWEIGGTANRNGKEFWRHYLYDKQSLIYVVDCNDRERIEEARDELMKILACDEHKESVLLVFANKQDLPNAMNATEIVDKLRLHSLRNRNWNILETCATSGDEGIFEGLDWLSKQLKSAQR